MSTRKTQISAPKPLVVRDNSRFVSGFVAGLLVVAFALGVLFLSIKRQERLDREGLAEALEQQSEVKQLAIERAEELNLAKAKYVETCGIELAQIAWRETGRSDQRYELLSAFIPFSPPSLEEYMPGDFEIVMGDELGLSPDGKSPKVQLVVGETMIDY